MDLTHPASTSAQKADAVFFFVFALSVAFLIFITGLMIYFVWRYDHRRHPVPAQIPGHTGLEILWTAIPLVLFLVVFQYGWTSFEFMRRPPRDALVVRVEARQWAWSFLYPNGKQTEVLYAPLQRPIKVEVTTADVIHGFYVPAFRLKIDAVPNRVNTAWFQAMRPGSFDILCTVICGVGHSEMLSKVVVVSEADFKAWYFGGEEAPEPGPQSPAPPAQTDLLRDKGCLACHTTDGTPLVGPTFKGLFGRQESITLKGRTRTVTLTEDTLGALVQKPQGERVAGYPPVMPPAGLTPQELSQVLAALKELE